MDDSPATETADASSTAAFERGFDWAIGGILVVIGVIVALLGFGVNGTVTRPLVARAVRNGDVRWDSITESEAIELFAALGNWGGIGLVAVGLVLIGGGVAVVVYHGRARERGDRTPRWVLGVVGALLGTLLGMVPLSPLLGGGAAGYLEPDEQASGLANGALAGLFAVVPLLVWVGVTSVGLFSAVGGTLALYAGIFGAAVVVFSLVYFVGLSAAGGFVGGKLR